MPKLVLVVSGIVASLLVGTVDGHAQNSHALLVGVSRYPSLADKFQLDGPPNDVKLMRKLLIDRFHFPADGDAIRVMSEEEGSEDPTMLPTRKNIQREFSRLAEVAESGDTVVIFMAGHGAQQPEQEDAEHPEPDGLDQIFLPRDVDRWEDDGSSGEVPNAIADNEIGKWLKAIRVKGVRLWVVFDCCHSGDITRGIGEKERFVPDGEEGLAIPPDAMKRARERRSKLDEPALPAAFELDRQDGMAILYACQRNEKAIEKNLPTPTAGQRYGLLTYSLNTVLSKAEAPLSYEELGKRVHLEYLRLGRTSGPTPLVEGGDIKGAVLGSQSLTRPPIIIRSDRRSGRLRIDVGRLHGVTTSSILAVFPPAGEKTDVGPASPIGYVRVDSVDIAHAVVSACEYHGVPAARQDALMGGRCEVAQLDYGDMTLGVSTDASDSRGEPVPEEALKALQTLLVAAVSEERSLARVAEPAEADWLLRWDAGYVYLVPVNDSEVVGNRRGAHGHTRSPLRLFKIGAFRSEEKEVEEIRKALATVARAHNLLQLAAISGTPASGLGAFSVEFEVEVRRLTDQFDRRGEQLQAPARTKPGDLVQFIVRNKGNLPFDLTLLYVDSRYGIAALFPSVGENNRFQPGNVKQLPAIEIHDETFGREHVVVIAIAGKSEQPISFASLEQPSLEKYRSGRKGGLALHRILEKSLYGEGTTRAAGRKEVTAFRMDVLPVDVVATPE